MRTTLHPLSIPSGTAGTAVRDRPHRDREYGYHDPVRDSAQKTTARQSLCVSFFGYNFMISSGYDFPDFSLLITSITIISHGHYLWL